MSSLTVGVFQTCPNKTTNHLPDIVHICPNKFWMCQDEFRHIKVPDMFCRDSHMSQKGTDILRNIPDNVQEIS